MFWQRSCPSVTFATTVWEKDWRPILLDANYLSAHQIENHSFPFKEKILIINNVSHLEEVIVAAERKIAEGILTRYIVAEEWVLSHFQLNRSDFLPMPGISPDWLYYNALGPLTALYEARSDYLLYQTGDVRIEKKVYWIEKAIRRMEKVKHYKVANLVWNENYKEANKESYKKEWNFYISNHGFSDQMFLVKTADFCKPIYGEIHPDSHHFPRGDVWEKRVFSYMKNHGWERITYRRGSYIHENF